jgi:hypothetical protein
MAYTTINKSTNYFETKLYVANQSQRNITGFNFNPDWVWIHNRTQSVNSLLFDKVRGATKQIHTNTTGAENTDAQALNAFITNGFSLGTGWGNQSTNDNYVSWNWSAGNSSGSSNTDGSITSTVSVNNTSKMSIVKYTGNGSDQTVGHGLGVVPSMIIVKCISATHDWVVYHQGMGNAKAIAFNNYNNEYSATAWQSYTPTNQVFYIKGGANSVSQSGDFIAYCFADVIGYQKCGTYIGNGNADGTFVYTGFKPAMMFFKRTTGAVANWQMWDNKRDPDNPVENAYHIDSNDADGSPDQDIDFLSNGFKIKSNQGHLNASGVKFIYYAVAEASLVGSNNVPCTAR